MLGIIGYATLPLPLFSHAQAIVVCTTTQQSWIHFLGVRVSPHTKTNPDLLGGCSLAAKCKNTAPTSGNLLLSMDCGAVIINE